MSAQSEAKLFIDSMKTSVETSVDAAKLLVDLVSACISDSNAGIIAVQTEKSLEKGIKENKIDVIEIPPKYMSKMKGKLEEAGISVLNPGGIKRSILHSSGFLFVAPEHRAEVLSALNEFDGNYLYHQSPEYINNDKDVRYSQKACLSYSEAVRLQSELNEHGISPTDIVVNHESNCYMVRYPGESDEIVGDIYKGISKKYVTVEDLGNLPSGTMSVTLNDEVTAYMVSSYVEGVGGRVNIVTEGIEDNAVYKLRYPAEDQDLVKMALRNIAIDLAGESGKVLKRQVEYYLDEKYNAINSLIDGEDKVVVDHKGNTIVTSGNYIQCNINGRGDVVYRSDGYEVIIEDKVINDMDKPVVLSIQQYEEYKALDEDGKNTFLKSVEIEKGKPEVSKEMLYEMKTKEDSRILLNEKLARSHAEEIIFNVDEYDSLQSLTDFDKFNIANAEADYDMAKVESDMSVILNDAAALYSGIVKHEEAVDVNSEIVSVEVFSSEHSIEIPNEDQIKEAEID